MKDINAFEDLYQIDRRILNTRKSIIHIYDYSGVPSSKYYVGQVIIM